jgi:two-component system sensor histidine kinase PhoQ
MAVVADLVSAYQGQLEIKQSDLGGAKLTLVFPTVYPTTFPTKE